MKIIVTYTSIDKAYIRRTFRTVGGARRFAERYVGKTPEASTTFGYAVSDDGIGKVEVHGDATVLDLFPRSVG